MTMDEKDFLTEQLLWVEKQRSLYDQIIQTLTEMKQIAEYTSDSNVSDVERAELQGKMDVLRRKVEHLEGELKSVLH